METLFLNIVKTSGLIALFYIAYFLLLRKETFFTANRWFLLAGLLTSVILPWIVYTTVIWVEPVTSTMDWTKIPTTPIEKESFEIDWYLVLAIAYAIGMVLFLLQFAFDFYHLNRVIKGKAVQKQADHKFIDLKENIAPFSYFNTIVYNSSLYSELEMQSILEHEKVHSEQYHTIDVLITRVFCILFWFNPIIWLYKNAILQNLEFIADREASKNISNKKAYQLTLLKITTHENCVVLTNHFYQSLIKKRIVMLNKNQSKKWNSLKYALIIPALIAFIYLFQNEVIAKEKKAVLKNIELPISKEVEIIQIDKNTTDTELKEKAETISKNYGVTIHFSKKKRNANNELTAIAVEIKKGKEIAENRTIKSNEPIKSFVIIISEDENGKLAIDFAEENHSGPKIAISKKLMSTHTSIPADTQIIIDDEKVNKEIMEKLAPEDIASIDVNKNDIQNEIRIITKKHINNGTDEEFYINGEKVDKITFNQTNPNNITRMDVNTDGKKTIKIITRNNFDFKYDKDVPVPPTPPVLKIKAPAPPALPKAPKAPKGGPYGDKKAWKEYEKQMEDYEAMIKKMEPQMANYEKQMKPFENEMKAYEAKMKAYEEKMKAYEEKMKAYEEKMKAYEEGKK